VPGLSRSGPAFDPTSGLEETPQLVAVLVDFDNFYTHERVEVGAAWLEHEVIQMVRLANDLLPDVGRVVIRLYGGWMENGVLTQRGSALQQAIAIVDPFPLPLPGGKGLLRGELVLATRLFSLASVEWGHTLKTREGLPKLKLAAEMSVETCPVDRDTCPVKSFAHFSKKLGKTCHIAACTATNRRTFIRQEQKMIDTMMACDILTMPRERGAARLLVFSEDTDLLPPIAVTAGVSGFPIDLVLPRQRRNDPYAAVLEGLGVGLLFWGSR
jgi:hypothetical protein